MMYTIQELQAMLNLPFNDADAHDSLRNHEMNCYVLYNTEVIPKAVAESSTYAEFIAALKKYALNETEKVPVNMKDSQDASMVLCNMKYAYDKGAQVEAAKLAAHGEKFYHLL